MKISQSALLLGYEYKKNTSNGTLTSTRVELLGNDASNNGSTASRRAGIVQSQQQTLTDSISSSSQSLVTDQQTGETQYFESSEFLQSVSALFVEEDMTVTAVQTLDGNSVNQGTSFIEVTSISQFESDTHIQANAMGMVTTEDGREIGFMLELNYDRNIKTTQQSTFTGQRDLIDPLVINLNGGAPSLSSSYFEFDLNSDGENDTINQTASGTGFLALDKNQNGSIDNGKELFGPNSHSGFGELAQYDDDNNGWIDENDAIFSQLSYMDFDENGEQRLQSISDVGLGAIYLGSKEMDLDLFDSSGNFQANIARNGIALKENGEAVSLQEIHYSDQAIGKVTMEQASSLTINNQSIENGNPGFIVEASGEMIIEATEIRVESVLTQFQFDNEIINGRNADTSVRINASNQTNTISVNGIRTRLSSNNLIAQSLNGDQSTSSSAQTAQQTNNASTQTAVTQAQRRESIQSIFQAKIEAGITIENTNRSSNKHNQETVEVATLSQSVFWQDERNQYQSRYEGGTKLEQLKQLVDDLKSIREQQVKSQEKLGLYIQVGKRG